MIFQQSHEIWLFSLENVSFESMLNCFSSQILPLRFFQCFFRFILQIATFTLKQSHKPFIWSFLGSVSVKKQKTYFFKNRLFQVIFLKESLYTVGLFDERAILWGFLTKGLRDFDELLCFLVKNEQLGSSNEFLAVIWLSPNSKHHLFQVSNLDLM